ncbi:hypothetical protein NDU88_004466 [Pleurodeles waltl]|uniref:Uncharacterized protein n=1 Tax=Pleurodeles waltl TaxID=8319 RepID=A0AAV7MV81_PLEWA|nr:hypothetical protein NDU88_004466 [Pleurodeles waltl]
MLPSATSRRNEAVIFHCTEPALSHPSRLLERQQQTTDTAFGFCPAPRPLNLPTASAAFSAWALSPARMNPAAFQVTASEALPLLPQAATVSYSSLREEASPSPEDPLLPEHHPTHLSGPPLAPLHCRVPLWPLRSQSRLGLVPSRPLFESPCGITGAPIDVGSPDTGRLVPHVRGSSGVQNTVDLQCYRLQDRVSMIVFR